MTDPLHIVCQHCHTAKRVRQADLGQAPDRGLVTNCCLWTTC